MLLLIKMFVYFNTRYTGCRGASSYRAAQFHDKNFDYAIQNTFQKLVILDAQTILRYTITFS